LYVKFSFAFILVSYFVEEEGRYWMGNPKDRDGRVWMPTVEKPKLKHIQAIKKCSFTGLQPHGVFTPDELRATAPLPTEEKC